MESINASTCFNNCDTVNTRSQRSYKHCGVQPSLASEQPMHGCVPKENTDLANFPGWSMHAVLAPFPRIVPGTIFGETFIREVVRNFTDKCGRA